VSTAAVDDLAFGSHGFNIALLGLEVKRNHPIEITRTGSGDRCRTDRPDCCHGPP
jgi:hypothetical protein